MILELLLDEIGSSRVPGEKNFTDTPTGGVSSNSSKIVLEQKVIVHSQRVRVGRLKSRGCIEILAKLPYIFLGFGKSKLSFKLTHLFPWLVYGLFLI